MQSCLYHPVEAESGRLYEPGKGHYRVSFHGSPAPLDQGSRLGVSHTEAFSSPSVPNREPAIAPSASAKPVPSVTSEQFGRERLGAGSGELSHSAVPQVSPSQLQATLKMFQQALAIAQAKNNRITQVNILKRIGIIHGKLGEHAWGIKCLKQALQLAQDLGHPVSVGVILNYLGAAYRQTGQEHKALRVYLRALDIVKGIGNEAGVALLLNHLGAVYNSLGQSDQALTCSRQALETFHGLGNAPDGEATALHNIGEIYLQMRRYRQALAFLEQALAIEQKIGNRKGEAKVLESIATVYVRVNQERQALDLYQQAWEIRREVGDSPNVEARCIDYIGAIQYKIGNRSRALWHHLQALGMLQAHNYAFGSDRFLDDTVAIAKLLQNLVAVYDRLGLHSQGMKCYQQALDIIGTFGENACEEAIHNFLEQEEIKNS